MSVWGTTDDQPDKYEADRYAIAQLLDARGHTEAASIVAVSVYRSECVDNLNGGQFEAVLEVPPRLYDRAKEEFAGAISSAAEALIGADHFWGLRICLLAASPHEDWIEEIVRGRRPRHVDSERADIDAQAIGVAAQ